MADHVYVDINGEAVVSIRHQSRTEGCQDRKMSDREPPTSVGDLRRGGSCPAVPAVWITVTPHEQIAALVGQIAAYGYSVLTFDPANGLPAPNMSRADTVIINAPHRDISLGAWIASFTALAESPSLLVIDHGLEPIDRILALEAGADDCVMSSCDPRELIARMRTIARRRQGVASLSPNRSDDLTEDNILSFGGWTLNRAQRRLTRPGATAENLPASEFAVLDHLLSNPHRVVSREALLNATASAAAPEQRNLRSVDIQVSRLRKRLEIQGDEVIRTVRGSGYLLLPPVVRA